MHGAEMSPPPRGVGSPLLVTCSRKRRLRSEGILSSDDPRPLQVFAPGAEENRPIVDYGRNPLSRESDGLGIRQDEADAQYKLLLEHLNVDDKSYVFEVVIGGSRWRIKYEQDEDSCVTAVRSQPRKRRLSTSSRACNAKKRRKNNGLGQEPCEASGPRAPLSQSGWDVGGSLIDEDYQVFLNHVKACGRSMILQYGNNVTIVYEKERNGGEEVQEQEEEEEEEEEIGNEAVHPMEMEMKLYDDPLQTSSSTASYFDELLQHRSSSFRDRLMDILRKPFDQKEFENMMSLINIRNPIVKYKELRNGSKPYMTNQLGSSYLDCHPDLARRISSAFDDHHKSLFLHGFFFWLKNVGYEGAFKPWVPALPDHIDIECDDTTILSVQNDMSEGEEKKGSEGKEVQEEKEGENNMNIVHEGEEKEWEEVKELKVAEIKLCGKESDVCPGEMEIKSYHGSLQSSTSLGLQASEDVGYSVETLQHTLTSSFQSRLTSVLEMPFDQVEYERLMSLISLYMPEMKDLGDESRPYTTNQLGYSSPDHYPDLVSQIKSADPNRSLLLLRGFFFWLQNRGYEGAYKPWATGDPNKTLQD
ncbi:unnamed protein product [Musa acuminata subsp. malaccensis]|uniref:(wild Malaysian banana) hypothetical protein n=1 Tax=Musa acuminata subsp. malaccensis TaxID=214687 RepID=A0A804IRQ2_MUSAM|nr:PREDICTED: uncharacterized protein LOC103986926 [Musa acuminata subsp. malaccensis]CAG1842805.1 unnamed protein product [Musa acuminata subsp. malaccensis]